jgi:GNAT superfamily N-acetyltransferase
VFRRIVSARDQVEMSSPWRTAAVADWADKIHHTEWDHRAEGGQAGGQYTIDHPNDPDRYLGFLEYVRNDARPSVAIKYLEAHPDYPRQGVASALMQRLHADHPQHMIVPGTMTSEGQGFKNRMVEQHPEASDLLIARRKQAQTWLQGVPADPLDPEAVMHSFLLDPSDAYDAHGWFERHRAHPSISIPTDVDWFHGSPADLPIGTVLAPRRGNPPWLDHPYHGGLDNRANFIWVEYDLTHSDEWMHYFVRDHGQAFLYRVKPRLGPFPWNGSGHEGWVTDAAVIIGVLAHYEGGEGHVERVAMPTYYHVTDNPNFKLDPNFTPEHIGYDSGDEDEEPDVGPGIYLTQNPDLWRHSYPGRSDRGYNAQFDTAEDLKDYPEMTPGWSRFDREMGTEPEQYFVPNDYFNMLTPKGVERVSARTRGVYQMPIELAKQYLIHTGPQTHYPSGEPVEEDLQEGNREYQRKMQDTLTNQGWEGFKNMPAFTVGSGGRHAVMEDGNHRVWAADALGYTHVPVAVTTHEDPNWAAQYGKRVTPELRQFLKENLT